MDEYEHFTSICSAATLQSNKNGFFLSYVENVLELAGPQWLEEFRQLTSDTDRLHKCYNDPKLFEAVHGVLQNVQHLFRSKAARLSQLRRLEGEKAARSNKLERALMLLNQSVIRASKPGVDTSVDEGLSLPLALWSRAQVLWQLSEYALSLSDLKLCLKEKLPDKLRTEAYWSMSQCYQRMGEYTRAKVTLQVILKIIGPEDASWKHKVEAELQHLETVNDEKPDMEKDPEELLDGSHSQLPGLSSALRVCSGERTGRYVVTQQPVRSGDVLAVEPPHIACLIPDKFGTHCHHCFKRLRTAVACGQCAGLAYCSAACSTSAQGYHQHECRYMDLMIGSGMSILCHIALRTVTQQKYSYWQKVYRKQPVSPDYNRLATLVTHANKRQPKDFVGRTLMALFLLQILVHSRYIPPSECEEDELTGMHLFLGTVLLHMLQCLQFNAHEIYETLYKSEMSFSSSKINYIGVGIYPSVAMFNHDCYPAITRYFRGKELVIRAVRPLKPGDTVAENYGPVYTMRTLAERQRSLAGRYWFSCVCTACNEDWPKLTEFDENVIHIRCQKKDCDGFISTTKDTKKQKSKCPKCDSTIDVVETVLLVKSYDDDYEQGLALVNEGKLKEAAQLLSTYSDVMHVICRPPIKNVSLAHEVMRSCWSYQYNKHIVNC